MTVGERIKTLRKELGMSADILAEKLGVSRSTIFRYEKGEIEKLPASALEPIALALGTSVAFLMGWEDIGVTEDMLRNERIKHMKEDQENFGDKLSDDELSLIKLFRLVPEGKRKRVLSAIRLLLSTEE